MAGPKPRSGPEQVQVEARAGDRARVLSALCGMGFARREAARALEQVGQDGAEDSAMLLRRALGRLVPERFSASRVRPQT
ncbi:MAG: RuvA C-terminal domain-containing protein [Myxococcota bacterium]